MPVPTPTQETRPSPIWVERTSAHSGTSSSTARTRARSIHGWSTPTARRHTAATPLRPRAARTDRTPERPATCRKAAALPRTRPAAAPGPRARRWGSPAERPPRGCPGSRTVPGRRRYRRREPETGQRDKRSRAAPTLRERGRCERASRGVFRLLLHHLHTPQHARWESLDEPRRLAKHHAGCAVEDVDRVAQVQVLLRARDRDVEQAALLLHLLRIAQVLVGGEPPVDQPDHEHRAPLEPLGRVDGGERQEPFVLVARRQHVADAVTGWLRAHVGEERPQAAVARRDGEEVLRILLALR